MRYLIGFGIIALIFSSFMEDTPVVKKSSYKAFFGCAYTDSSVLDVKDFLNQMNNKLCAKDSAGNVFPIESFEMIYAERGLFQDSSGLPIIHVDYSLMQCKGDSIPSAYKNIFLERAYKGDTVYFDKVVVRTPEKYSFLCKSIKMVLK